MNDFVDTKSLTQKEMLEMAQESREASKRAAKRRQESWERSDTDGFLTQWAAGKTSSLENRRCGILENGGKAEFTGLYEGNRRVKAQLREGDWGYFWLLDESETDLIDRRGKPFLPSGPRSRVLKGLGLAERKEMDWAWAKLDGRGTGLSGTCWVATFRTGDKWGQDAELIS